MLVANVDVVTNGFGWCHFSNPYTCKYSNNVVIAMLGVSTTRLGPGSRKVRALAPSPRPRRSEVSQKVADRQQPLPVAETSLTEEPALTAKMPKILDAGSVQLSNADVLDWISRKRTQHAQEAAEDKAAGLKKTFLPDNYQRALRKHERELSSRKYPYTDNPGAYKGPDRLKAADVFMTKLDERIITPLEAGWREELGKKGQDGARSQEEVLKEFDRAHEMKGLTKTEHLIIYNLAPQCVETLQNIIVDHEERFTEEEMVQILEAINEVYRCGEKMPDVDAVNGDGR